MSPRIVIYGKQSKAASDMERWRLDEFELEEEYRQRGIPEDKIERIFDSHRTQSASLALLLEHLPDATLVQWSPRMNESDSYEEWSGLEWAARNSDILVALGGDNNLQFASHYRLDEKPLIGLNSDPGPKGSRGKLLWGSVEAFVPYAKRLLAGDYIVEPWVRLELELNGRSVGMASNQISLGAKDPMLMSRHVLITPDGEKVEQTGSGLLVTTPAGSTGWYRSEREGIKHDFPRNAQEARWWVRAAQRDDDDSVCARREGILLPGESLHVRSLNEQGGYAGVDDRKYPPNGDSSHDDKLNFDGGSEAIIRISRVPLNVITF